MLPFYVLNSSFIIKQILKQCTKQHLSEVILNNQLNSKFSLSFVTPRLISLD